MDLQIFKEKLKQTSTLSKNDGEAIIRASLARCDEQTKCMIIMEELAELSQAASKACRANTVDEGQEAWYGLLEEMADVYICLEFLKKLFAVDDCELDKAIAVKLLREKERCTQSRK